MASGVSRREAMRATGAVVVGGIGLSASEAWARATITCPSHEMLCRGHCINLASNVKNCGKCGHACKIHQICCNGRCVTVCPTGTTNCGGVCVYVQSNANQSQLQRDVRESKHRSQ